MRRYSREGRDEDQSWWLERLSTDGRNPGRCRRRGPRTLQPVRWSEEHDNVLNIIVCDYSTSGEIENVYKGDIETVCKRATNFISKCLNSSFLRELDNSSPEYGHIQDLNYQVL